MRTAIVENGMVVNVCEADQAWVDANGGVPTESAGIGWGFVNGVFTPPPVDLAPIRATKAKEIETARDAACCVDVSALGRAWQADKRSQELLGQAITLAQAGLPLPAVWRDATNSDMPVTALADLLAIAGAIATQTQIAYTNSWALKAQVVAATTVEQVAAVVW